MRGAGLALYNPLTDNWGELVLVAGHPAPKPGEQAGASWDRVNADYLQRLGVGLVRGRYLNASDNDHSENVAVVNEAFVKRFFKSDEDPIDQHFGLDLPENVNTYRIVGIVRDVAGQVATQLDLMLLADPAWSSDDPKLGKSSPPASLAYFGRSDSRT